MEETYGYYVTADGRVGNILEEAISFNCRFTEALLNNIFLDLDTELDISNCQDRGHDIVELVITKPIGKVLASHSNVRKITLCEGCEFLDCADSKVNELTIPDSLIILECEDCELENLDSLPNLKRLFCEGNSIKEITLPKTIKKAYCDLKTRITNYKEFISEPCEITLMSKNAF